MKLRCVLHPAKHGAHSTTGLCPGFNLCAVSYGRTGPSNHNQSPSRNKLREGWVQGRFQNSRRSARALC